MARTDPQINLRIPADLKDALDAEAVKNKRSLTAEVVARLEASLGGSVVEGLTPNLRAIVEVRAKMRGMPIEQALAELIVAGEATGAPAVIYMSVQPGSGPAEFVDALLAARKYFPEATEIMVDHFPPGVHEESVARRKAAKKKA